MSKTGSSRMPPVSLWVGMFSLLYLKGFADFSIWNYGFVEFLSPALVGGSFFFFSIFLVGCGETGSLGG